MKFKATTREKVRISLRTDHEVFEYVCEAFPTESMTESIARMMEYCMKNNIRGGKNLEHIEENNEK